MIKLSAKCWAYFILCIIVNTSVRGGNTVMKWYVHSESNDTLLVDKIGKDSVFSSDNDLLHVAFELAYTRKAVLKLGARVYRVNRLLLAHPCDIVGVENKTIIENSDTAIPGAFITTEYPLKISSLIIDAKYNANYGIYSTENLLIDKVTLRNCRGDNKRPGAGIRHAKFGKEIKIENSEIMNIDGFEDGIGGNAIGANRGIFCKGGNVMIRNSVFKGIEGIEDGDCIHIQTSHTDKDEVWGTAGTVVIEGCEFRDFGKRAIKIAASDVVVRKCKIFNQRASDEDIPMTGISVMGSRNIIEGNEIYLTRAVAGIGMTSGTDNKLIDNLIVIGKGSSLQDARGTKMTGIYFDNASNTSVVGNKIEIASGGDPYKLPNARLAANTKFSGNIISNNK